MRSGVYQFAVLLGRLEGQRLTELESDAADVGAEFIDAADLAVTDEVGQIKSVGHAGLGTLKREMCSPGVGQRSA